MTESRAELVTKRRSAGDGLAFAWSERYLACLAYIGEDSAHRQTGPGLLLILRKRRRVAKVNPGEFFRQVRAETAKVVWPTRKETLTTALMVVIMTSILGVFFFGVDTLFGALVRALLGLVG